MTLELKNKNESRSRFSDWLRENPNLDSKEKSLNITDNDFILHQYKEPGETFRNRSCQKIMLLEVKRNVRKGWDKSRIFAQTDTLLLEHQAFLAISKTKLKTLRGDHLPTNYYGSHLILLEGETPDDGAINIDMTFIMNKKEFEDFLLFKSDKKIYEMGDPEKWIKKITI